jgi:ribonuclease III
MSADSEDPRAEQDVRAALERALGHHFADAALLDEALTHRSYANEQGLPTHNERLEFLGDAVLGLHAAEWLYRRHPESPEGELARAKSALVSASVLAGYAEKLALGEALRLGVGEARSGGHRKASLLADGLEALFGAVHLEAGADRAREILERYFEWAETTVDWWRNDAKTELQERLQARGVPLPTYAIVAEEGPDHDKLFRCQVTLDGELLGEGSGRTKKESHQQAAASALLGLAERDLGLLQPNRRGGE